MSYGLIGAGQQLEDDAYRGFANAAGEEQSRNQANKQLKMAEKAAQMSAIGTGAGIGASIGAANVAAQGGIAAMGGWGAAAGTVLGPIAIGAVAAYALTELL